MRNKLKPKEADKSGQKNKLPDSAADNGDEFQVSAVKDKTQKTENQASKKISGDRMSKLLDNYSDQTLPEIPELDEILELPKNIREEAFVRAVCTAHKAKVKANKKVKQTLSWIHTDSEN